MLTFGYSFFLVWRRCAFCIFFFHLLRAKNVFNSYGKFFVEFQLNDRNSILKLNVSQQYTDEYVGTNKHDDFYSTEMRNSFEYTERWSNVESGNLMTCRGLIRIWPESLVVNLNFTPLYPSLLFVVCRIEQFELNDFFSAWLIWRNNQPHTYGKCAKLKWKWPMFRGKWKKKLRKIEYSRQKRISYANMRRQFVQWAPSLRRIHKWFKAFKSAVDCRDIK